MSDLDHRQQLHPPTGGMAPLTGVPCDSEMVRSPEDTEPSTTTPGRHDLLRLCRRCSTETATDANRCPVCSTLYLRKPWWTRPWVWLAAGAAAVLAAGAISLILWNTHQTQVAEEQHIAAERAAAEQEAADQEAAERAARNAAAAAVAEREATIPQIEQSITKMARQHSREGFIEGWPKATRCSPTAGQSMENLNKSTTGFSCFVITERNSDGTSSGHYYHALMNWDTGRYTYGYGER